MRDDSRSEKVDTEKRGRLIHFELSPIRVGLYSCCLVLALCWMFVFGVLVGRGIPLVDLDSTSLRAQLIRFLGLARQPVPPTEHAADTWDPQTVLKSLDYYENLTQTDAPQTTQQKEPSKATIAKGKETDKDAAAQKAKTLGQQAGSTQPENERTEGEKTAKNALKEAPLLGKGEEHFTLLVVSLRDAANAQKLVDQLKTKGYSPRLENLDLNTGGRWNRVLLGSFESREDALRFAAEFNRKEHMEGLVIRETQ
jgi:cell division septation protein DedD